MARVKGRDTGPELVVRRMLHALGYRYRLHGHALPGRPDLVFASRRAVVFVHGCFWHGHDCARGARMPATRRDYWTTKLGGNVARDRRNLDALAAAGWRTTVVWECELRDAVTVRVRLTAFLQGLG